MTSSTTETPVQGPYTTIGAHQAALKDLHDLAGMSWRRIAQTVPEYIGLSIGSLDRIAHGIEPGSKVRRQLGLPPTMTVAVMGGEITPGAQAIGESLCPCGQTYISNHPRRKHCFACRPFRKGKGKQ